MILSAMLAGTKIAIIITSAKHSIAFLLSYTCFLCRSVINGYFAASWPNLVALFAESSGSRGVSFGRSRDWIGFYPVEE